MKNKTHFPFLEIESIPQLIKDFLAKDIEGFETAVFNLENMKLQLEAKKNTFSAEQRAILSNTFISQYKGFELTEFQTKNIELLSNDNTFTVTTGHQLNLFTGPAFFIYKILQTIKLADFLNTHFLESKVIPVFWMATEDHDFEEINHFSTDKNYYEISADSGGAVGRIKVKDTPFIAAFEEEFKDSPFGEELIALVKKAYKEGNTLAQATRIIVHQLFSQYGLLVLDGDNRDLKMQMKSLFKEELLHQTVFESTKDTIDFLVGRYGKVQVNPREINLFYLTETRDRIAFENDQFILVDKDKSFSKEELLSALEQFPESFSPNALLRPVFQEVVLPNLAYIGGNAEIMYWLELKDYFAKINIPFPILIPRASVLVLNQKTLDKTETLGLNRDDYFRDLDQVSKELLLVDHDILTLLNQQKNELEQQFQKLKESAKKTDVTFGNLVDAEKTRQLKSFKRMQKRLLRAEKIKQSEKLNRTKNLFETVHPGNKWQERTLNFSSFYCTLGPEWLQNCYREIRVEHSELIILPI
ncbi:bacillithiol biosynthesis cysteine-adding enzyme BshC [Chryseobacterium sp. MP_3.2]|uniref:bacillithiol biosynthesis cysteine-adding enzyme BshC n=1 Tax=Chryseobacterium sp. MP_3.2 TaxID=3071712 RepID=UPI002E00E9F1|nr:bacillithiol biosynthesis cysteine-adding enzyme BshC [Chryseobacterium sp. MP_3.2]